MNWHFVCPNCNQWHYINWEKRMETFICPIEETEFIPPSPAQQHNAYVDTHIWPAEMEDAVVELKGNKCTVDGCDHCYETLDHHVAFSKGGKTSVFNLFPMCNKHNLSKGNLDYYLWRITMQKR